MQKQEIDAGEALKVLFSEKWADFAMNQYSLEEVDLNSYLFSFQITVMNRYLVRYDLYTRL
jgi:hypothetical protein